MVKIVIDGHELQASAGDMIIEVADAADIYIPRFCYHKKLSIAANCRMCLVDVANNGKSLPACATPVVEGMQISTKSAKALYSQRSVMEFLLINHPLDCPICDQGGECELQDLSMGYGWDSSKFTEEKRVVADYNIGPFITTNMTRCIHCTRCIRFGKEIAGVQDLGLINRGDDVEVRTYVDETVKSNLSGNLIDICPVGALNSKPYAFQARSWELKSTASIAPHDCLGANIFLHTREQKIFRVVSKDNQQVNDIWLSDRDRFSYLGIQHSERLPKPYFKESNGWIEKNWHDALTLTSAKLKINIDKYTPKQVAGIISPNSTFEELYLFNKLIRALGTNNIDHRIREQDFSDQEFQPLSPTSMMSADDLQTSDGILIVGSNIGVEQPLLTIDIKSAIGNGAKIYVINPIDHKFNFDIAEKIIVNSALLPQLLAVMGQYDGLPGELANSIVNEARSIFASLANCKKVSIVTGAHLYQHKHASTMRVLLIELQKQLSAKLMYLTQGANSTGAWLAGCIPHRTTAGEIVSSNGLSALDSFKENLQTYILFGIEPELDCLYPGNAMNALKQASLVIVCSPYITEQMLGYADIVLPIATFAETDGTYINLFGSKQKTSPAILPIYDCKPGWEVLRDLGNSLDIAGMEYQSNQEVYQEVTDVLQQTKYSNRSNLNKTTKSLKFVSQSADLNLLLEWPENSVDCITRRSYALQQANTFSKPLAYINPEDADRLSLIDGEQIILVQQVCEFPLTLSVEQYVPKNCLYIPLGIEATSNLTEGKIEIKKC